MPRVVLAMSGGVDSSVSAYLLREQGYEVVGVFMRHGEGSPASCSSQEVQCGSALPITTPATTTKQGCCTAKDAEDARRVADALGLPFYVLNLEEEFGRIMDYFTHEYASARTPNPCVMCNHQIKFGKLFDYANGLNAEWVATGHYARLEQEKGDGPGLHRGMDESKDQSYVLFGIERNLLRRILLPLGSFHKPQIRQLATDLGLQVADKRDSQEICFVEPGKHDQFVRRRLKNIDTAGDIVTTAGEIVGRHSGIERFTIGQRKGLGLSFSSPRFVVRIEADTRCVVVGTFEELACNRLTASRMNWLVNPPVTPLSCSVQIRYNSRAVPATVQFLSPDCLHVTFDKPCYSVAPGQAVVCYNGSRVLGGGWIDTSTTATPV